MSYNIYESIFELYPNRNISKVMEDSCIDGIKYYLIFILISRDYKARSYS